MTLEYQAFEAEISDTMSQMSEDENKSRSSTKTREISTQTESEEERSPDHLIRHVPEEFMPTPSPRTTPRAKPRKIIQKENQNLPNREVTVGEKTKTISTSEYDSKPGPYKLDGPNEFHGYSRRYVARPYERPAEMPEFDVKHLLRSLRRFEYVCNFNDIVGDEERFIAATVEIPFHIIEGFFSIDDGHTKSYQKLKDHLIRRYHPLQDCHLEYNNTRTFNSDAFSLRERAEAASRCEKDEITKHFLYTQLPFWCRDKLKCRLYLPLAEFFNEVETEVTREAGKSRYSDHRPYNRSNGSYIPKGPYRPPYRRPHQEPTTHQPLNQGNSESRG